MNAHDVATPEDKEREPEAAEAVEEYFGAGGSTCTVTPEPAGDAASAVLDVQGLAKGPHAGYDTSASTPASIPGDPAHCTRTPTAVATRILWAWAEGQGIAATAGPPRARSDEPIFGEADFVAVEIDLAILPLPAILGAPYTAQFASVVAYPAGNPAQGLCLLAFELPAVETDASRYALLQAGLEARYAGARQSSGVLQTYRPAVGGRVEVLDARLDPEAVRQLIVLGKESKEIRRNPNDPVRSKLRLELDDVIVTDDREEMTLDEVNPDTEVFCPVHVDMRPTAIAIRKEDGRPLIACMHCQRGYTVRDASNDYDFARLDRVMRELSAEEDVERDATGGANPARRQFDIRQERYLASLPLEPGVLCVKSPKGSGKTEALVDVVKRCRKANQHVLLVGHRRTLLLSMARRLGLMCYILPPDAPSRVAKDKAQKLAQMRSGLAPIKESTLTEKRRLKVAASLLGQEAPEESDEASLRFGEPTFYYAVSLDSLTMLNPKSHRYDVVIIDEAEQVFEHLVGVTLRGKRREVFLRLEHYRWTQARRGRDKRFRRQKGAPISARRREAAAASASVGAARGSTSAEGGEAPGQRSRNGQAGEWPANCNQASGCSGRDSGRVKRWGRHLEG